MQGQGLQHFQETDLIFDNDGSSDDIIALLYALSLLHVRLKAITIAATGEAHGPQGVINFARLCQYFGIKDVPIAHGTDKPLSEHFLPFPDWLRKAVDDFLVNKEVDDLNAKVNNDAVKLIHDTILASKQQNRKVTILATGPLTNIAQFIQQHSELLGNIEKIVIMGGAIEAPGNVKDLHPNLEHNLSECNIAADPLAAHIVFSSKIPVVLVPLDVTNTVPITRAYYDKLAQSHNPDLHLMHLLLKDIHDAVLKLKGDFFKIFFLWDPLASMICFNPELAEYKKVNVYVDEHTGQIIIDPDSKAQINYACKMKEPAKVLDLLSATIEQRLSKIAELSEIKLQLEALQDPVDTLRFVHPTYAPMTDAKSEQPFLPSVLNTGSEPQFKTKHGI